MRVPVAFMNSSPFIWLSPPLPDEPNEYLPGLAFSSLMNDCRSVAGNAGLTTSTLGTSARLLTGAKSLTGS
ncbi:hypothetical protein D3C85_1900290 [compost metagenome]